MQENSSSSDGFNTSYLALKNPKILSGVTISR